MHSNARSLRCRGNLKSMMWIAFKIHCTTQWCIVTKIFSSTNAIIAITYNNYKYIKHWYKLNLMPLCQLPCLKCFINYDETCILDKFSLDEIVSKWIFVQYVFSPLLACLLTSASQCQKIRTRAHTSNTFSASKLLFSCIKIKSTLFFIT